MTLGPVASRSFLTLVGDLFREVGAAGTAPKTTVNQTGEALRLVNYIHDAELEIQNLWVDWKWLRKTLSWYTKAGSQTGIYTDNTGATSAFPADLAEWDYRSWCIYPAGSTPYQPISAYEWQEVRHEVLDTTDQDQPWRVIVMPDNTLRWDLIPDQAYQGFCEYRAVPYELNADTDVSNIPARFANRLIVEWARIKYGLFENASEQLAKGNLAVYGHEGGQVGALAAGTTGLLAQLENDQLPNSKNARLQQGNDIVIRTDYEPYGDKYWR